MIRAHRLLHLGRSLLLALLLIVIAAHAAAPLAQPLERAQGSAFSAATHDVAVNAGATLTVSKRMAPVAPPLPAIAPIIAVAALAPHTPAFAYSAYGQTGPPAAETSFAPVAARAPPAV